MKCPSCRQDTLSYSQLELGLASQTCSHCHGNWLLLIDYLNWKASIAADALPIESEIKIEAEESKQALICPVTGSIMLKYRISSNTTHRLDLSVAANGIWLDKGEWQLLKQQGLANKLNSIFTDPWQKKIRSESAKETFEALYARQFGEEAYQQLKTMRHWLDSQDKRSAMLAYLLSDNPYSAGH